MTAHCELESDLLDALAARRWPHAAEPALREHVRTCSTCADVAEVAAAFFEEREIARTEAAVPPASLVWWRCQLRAREESARLAARPIGLVQAAATICVALASLAAAPAASTWLRQLIATLGASGWSSLPDSFSVTWLLGATAYTTFPLLAVGVWIVLAPVVVYLALDE